MPGRRALRRRDPPRRAGRREGGRSSSSRPLSAAAIHRPSEPRGGHNPPAFDSPAASPRHRSAATHPGFRGPALSGGEGGGGGGGGGRGRRRPAGVRRVAAPPRGSGCSSVTPWRWAAAAARLAAGPEQAAAAGKRCPAPGCGRRAPRRRWGAGRDRMGWGSPVAGQWTLMLRPPDLGSRSPAREGVKTFPRVASGTSLGAASAAGVRGCDGVNTD